MEWKRQLTRTHYLILVTFLIAIGVGTASAFITITLSGDVKIEGILDMTNGKITNLAEPTNPSDATTKSYVDSGGGATKNIEVLDSSGDTGAYTSIAIGEDGFPVISYYSQSEDSLRFIHCTSIDCSTRDSSITLDSSSNVGLFSSVAIGADGFPVISYHDATNNKLKLIHCKNINCSTKDALLILDDGGQYSSLLINAEGTPSVVHYDPITNNGSLKQIVCDDIDCLGSISKVTIPYPNEGNDLGSHLSVSKNSDLPVIVFFDATNQHLVYLDCFTTLCAQTPGDDFENVTENTAVRDFLSVAEGRDGRAIFSYREGTTLKVISCSVTVDSFSEGCIAKVSSNLDPSGNSIGINSSIAIGSDGLPIIAYSDTTTDVLKLVKCKSLSCGVSHPPVIVDDGNGNRVGSHISITIGDDGYPVIAYRDYDADDLKFVHCTDMRCIS